MNASLQRALVAMAVAVTPALAAADRPNLLANPGFESGDFGGWSVAGLQVGVAGDATPIANAEAPFVPAFQNVRSGTFAGNALIRSGPAVFPDSEGVVLTQTVAVTRNAEMSVGFWLGNDSASSFGMPYGAPGLTQITVDGVGVLPLTTGVTIAPGSAPDAFVLLAGAFNTGERDSIQVSFAITGSGTSRAVASFDDFFLVAGPVAAIPEPETFALVALGLAVAPFARRRAGGR